MRKKIVLLFCIGMLTVGANAFADAWLLDAHWQTPLDWSYVNPCQDIWEEVEASGTEAWHLKARPNLDQEGGLESWDVSIHFNHQNGNGIGYDLEMETPGATLEGGVPKLDENGKFIRMKDENGDFITTDYEIPGVWNFNQRVQAHENINEVYICHLISHGNTGNLLIHINRSLVFKMVDENGDVMDPANWKIEIDNEIVEEGQQMSHVTEHVWCKCAGAGPDANGIIDCDAVPDSCIEPPIPYAGAYWRD